MLLHRVFQAAHKKYHIVVINFMLFIFYRLLQYDIVDNYGYVMLAFNNH